MDKSSIDSSTPANKPKRKVNEKTKPQAKRRKTDTTSATSLVNQWSGQKHVLIIGSADRYFGRNSKIDSDRSMAEFGTGRFEISISFDRRGVHGAWRSIRKIDFGQDFVFNRDRSRYYTWCSSALRLLIEKLLLVLRCPNMEELSGFGYVDYQDMDNRLDDLFRRLARFESLKRISCAKSVFFDVAVVLSLLRKSKYRGRLEELDMADLQFRDADTRIDFEPMPNLKKIWFRGGHVNMAEIVCGLADVPNLTTLRFCKSDTNTIHLRSILELCDRLEFLEFSISGDAENEAKTLAAYKQIFNLVGVLASKNLSALEIHGDTFYESQIFETASEIAFSAMLETCASFHRLKYLSIIDCNASMRLHNDKLLSIISDLPDLATLKFQAYVIRGCGSSYFVSCKN